MVFYLDADALTGRCLVDVPVLILHGLDGLHEVRGVAFDVDGVPRLEFSFVDLDHGDVQVAVIVRYGADRGFVPGGLFQGREGTRGRAGFDHRLRYGYDG